MLPLSELTITFKRSNDYLRLVLCIHLLVILVLLHSAFSGLIIGGILLLLLLPMIHIFRHRTPLPAYNNLSYHAHHWFLSCTNGHEIKYEKAAIHFDAGLFILLTLSGGRRFKTLVIFKDQFTSSQYRLLKFISCLGAVK